MNKLMLEISNQQLGISLTQLLFTSYYLLVTESGGYS